MKKASFDYADGLRRHMGQVSWEALPGRSVGILPGAASASYEQQAEFQLAIAKALTGVRGEDLLAQKLGLLIDGKVMSPGVWQNEVSPSHQMFSVMAPALGSNSEVDPAQKDLINAYADIMGWLLRQEGVGWHKPHYAVAKTAHNGVDIDIGRVLTAEEAVALEKALTTELAAHSARPRRWATLA